MMDPNGFLDLDALQDAIVSDIKAQYPALVTVEFYRTEDRKNLPLPAVLLDLCEFEGDPEIDDGTGMLSVKARFEAQIIFGFKEPNVKREIRKFAAAFAAWLRLRRWTGISTDAAEVVGAHPDEFDPRLDQYEVWCVEWSQGLYLGCNEWIPGPALPTGVLVGYAPDIGVPHKGDYTPIEMDPTIIDPRL